MLTFGSLFAGIGGFDLGFHRAGHRCLWQVEIDDAARGVLARHFPDAELWTDVTEILGDQLTPVDVITAGFPCQDLSVAGARAGLVGDRSGLFFEIARIVREMREATDGLFPKYVVLENVPGLLSSNERRDYAVVLGELAQLGAVDIGWRVCDAQYWGVAQRRRRVFIVCRFGDGASTAEILSLSSGGSWHTPPRREAGEGTARSFALGSHAGSGGDASNSSHAKGGPVGFGIVEEGTPALRAGRTQVVAGIPSVAPSLTASGRGTERTGESRGQDCLIPYIPTVAGTVSTRYGKGVNTTADDGAIIAYSFDWQKGNDVTNARPSTMNLVEDQSLTLGSTRTPAVAFTERTRADGRNVEAQEELAYSLNNPGEGDRTQENRVCYGISNQPTPKFGTNVAPSLDAKADGGGRMEAVVTPAMAVRRLTPLECERLQGFPDGWTACDAEGKAQSDSARYRQLGNAVAVPVAEWIARRMAEI